MSAAAARRKKRMTYEVLTDKLRGVHAVSITPFGENREIDYEGLGQHVEFLLHNGLEVIVSCGNTGEFYALSVEEAKAVTRFVAENVGDRAAVVAGIGYDLKTAIDMALAAQEAGADAVMVHQPVHPFLMAEGLTRYYAEIVQSVEMGVALYVRHVQINEQVLRKVTALDNVVAIKYAINNPPLFGRLVQSVEHPAVWICGTAEMWAPSFFAMGAEGFTSGLVNSAPEKALAMLTALNSADHRLVREIWTEVSPLERLRSRHHDGNNVSVIKEGMNLIGLPGGRVREPISELNETDRQELIQILKAWKKI
jgi:4-hydroxy-tetrahydrodipicolinate synthase